MLRSVIIAALSFAATAASGETIERTVPADKGGVIDALFGLERQNCVAYRVRNAKISPQPAHGVAAIVEQAAPLPKDYAQCAGKVVKAQWLVYRPAKGFRGTDTVSISYTLPINTGEQFQRYITVDYAVTVK
ncbi:hypothetical protein [Labrys wisconsinensis]|uniref:Uncharacterized protein n=1 Tax=Labrys wisconsinensis TaxID=425677 RepID=A0ABU0JBS3_9HYPH|nr:hypothetical protein [Labrys wisconsinensis]MDQ0470729.1 hypothetical protein [Labrys wisconsinensis]